MTREEAIAARYEIAGRTTLDERAVMRCAERGEGCELHPYGSELKIETIAAGAHELPEYAGCASVCQRHQPTQRHAWLLDVPIEALMAQGGAFAIDSLRCYLPRNHPEHRA